MIIEISDYQVGLIIGVLGTLTIEFLLILLGLYLRKPKTGGINSE